MIEREDVMHNEEINILFTSVGRRSYLIDYFRVALNGKGKIYATNNNELATGLLAADQWVISPDIYDETYISFLLQFCKEHKIKILISLFDVDLPVLAENKSKFQEIGVKVIVSEPEVISICNDKWETHTFLREHGLNTPKTHLDIEEALTEISQGNLYFPLIVKPRWGMGSIAVHEVRNEEELHFFYSRIQEEIKNSYLRYESSQSINESVLIQEKLRGQEYGLDVINNLNAQYQTTIVKKKLAMRSGETDIAEVVDKSALKELGKQLSSKLKHIGNMDVDIFVTDADEAYVLELNARFGGGYPFSHMAGVDLPRAIINWSCGLCSEEDVLKESYGVRSAKNISMMKI